MMPRNAITVEVQCRIVTLRWLLPRTSSQAGCEVELCAHLRRNISKSMCRSELGIQNDAQGRYHCRGVVSHRPVFVCPCLSIRVCLSVSIWPCLPVRVCLHGGCNESANLR